MWTWTWLRHGGSHGLEDVLANAASTAMRRWPFISTTITRSRDGLAEPTLSHRPHTGPAAPAPSVSAARYDGASRPPRRGRVILSTPTTPGGLLHFKIITRMSRRYQRPWSVQLALRKGEVLGLTWEETNLDTGQIDVSRQLQRVRRELLHREIKTEASEAPLPAGGQSRWLATAASGAATRSN